MRVKLALCGLAVLLLLAMTACGGGSASGGGGGGQVTLQSIAVAPNTPFNVGADQQFTATGHYSDGSTKDLTASVTWSSSDTSIATISTGGKATGVHGGQVTIGANDSGSGVSGSVNVQVNAVLQAIAISPIGPAVQTTKTVPFAATGSFNDGTQADVTSATSFASSDNTVASFAANVATGLKAGAVTVTATDGSFNSSTSLHVVGSPTPALSGIYTFTLFGADTRGTQFYAGSFTVDGAGNLAGVEDANTGAGIHTNVALSGTYTQYADGRGNFVFAANSIHANGLTLRFIADSLAASGKLAEFDGAGTLRGDFTALATAALDTADFVFRLGGSDLSNSPMGQVGFFTAGGAPNITGGLVDTNDFGTINGGGGPAAITGGSYTDPDANGRGTLSLITAAGTTNYVYYMADATAGDMKISLIQTDASPNTALGGVAEEQDSSLTSTDADLNGDFAFLLDHPVVVGSNGGADRGEFNKLGHLHADGAGNIAEFVQDEDNNVSKNPFVCSSSCGTYNITGSHARGVMTEIIDPLDPTQDETYIFYMISTSKMYMMATVKGAVGVQTAPTGTAHQQSTPFIGKPLDPGSYILAASELSEEYMETLGLFDIDASGVVSGVVDSSILGVQSSGVLSGTYGTVNLSTGRGPIVTPDINNNYLLYVISPEKAFITGVKGPDTDGTLEKR